MPVAANPVSVAHRPAWQRYGIAVAAIAAVTLAATPLLGRFDLANIVMLFLMAVLGLAAHLGRGPALLSAFLAVGAFDFFFVPPRFSMTVHDAQYLVTFAVMLMAALLTAEMAARLAQQAAEAVEREARTRALYEMARELAGAPTQAEVIDITRRFAAGVLDAQIALLLPDADGQLHPHPEHPPFAVEDHLVAMAYASASIAECDSLAADGYATAYLPLQAPTRIRGVAVIAPGKPGQDNLRQHRPLLETLASLVAIALERVHYVEMAQSSRIEAAGERFRSAVLSALSHDLRTPITALVGMADALAHQRPEPDAHLRESASALRDQARRVAGMVENLLDMARLQSGRVQLRSDWQSLEEIVGAAIKLLGSALERHPVRTELPPDLPLLRFDAVLIERVLGNLLENAAKYAPSGSPITIAARLADGRVSVCVTDQGPGFAANLADPFLPFLRGDSESPRPGVGLGLSICRAIVDAHGGSIAIDRASEGARVCFTLPADTPPTVEEESLPEASA